jgi:hypothetical protein
MTRILADLPDADIKWLDRLAAEQGKSRAAVLREAVKVYQVHKGDDRSWIERGYGYWADREDIPDGVDYQRAMREDRRPYDDL